MKLYNPILGGQYIIFEDYTSFGIDQIMYFENGDEILKKYPFLVNIDEFKYQPDYYIEKNEKLSFRKVKRFFQNIKNIIICDIKI
jgi:hypothetical protein